MSVNVHLDSAFMSIECPLSRAGEHCLVPSDDSSLSSSASLLSKIPAGPVKSDRVYGNRRVTLKLLNSSASPEKCLLRQASQL